MNTPTQNAKSLLIQNFLLNPLAWIWLIYIFLVFAHARALTPDEISFMSEARNKTFQQLIIEKNWAAYGSTFWILLKAIHNPYIIRALLIVLFIAIPLCILKCTRSDTSRKYVLLAWLALPLSWWTGKIISPEIPMMALVASAVYFYHTKKFPLAGLALGVAAGLKINAIGVVAYFSLLFLMEPNIQAKEKFKLLAKTSASYLVGFLLAFPGILFHPETLNSSSSSLGSRTLTESLQTILLQDRWEWDGVLSGGILTFSLMPVPLAIVMLLGFAKAPRHAIAFSATCLVYLIMNLKSTTQYGWYWMPAIPLLLMMIGNIDLSNKKIKYLMIGALAINAFQQIPGIFEQGRHKFEQIKTLSNRKSIAQCIQKNLETLNPKTVFNQSEHGIIVSPTATMAVFERPDDSFKEPQTNNVKPSIDADVVLVGARFLPLQAKLFAYKNRPIVDICENVFILGKKN